MTRVRALRTLIKYNILTPVALLSAGLVLSIGSPAWAFDANVVIPDGGSYTNSAVLNFTGNAISGTNATTITNTSTGGITSDGEAIVLDGNLGTLTNNGSIQSQYTAINIDGALTSFANAGSITSVHGTGVFVSGDVGTFTNAGIIGSLDFQGVEIDGKVLSFTNTASGHIEGGDSYGTEFADLVTSFTNAGEIRSFGSGNETAYFGAGVTTFDNSGVIQNLGYDANAVRILSDAVGTPAVTSFTNSGTIWAGKGAAVYIEGNGAAAGTILNSGNVVGTSMGFDIFGAVGDFTNATGGRIEATNSTLTYDGTATGVYLEGDLTSTFTNAGTIEATGSFQGKGSYSYGFAPLSAGVGITGDVNKFSNTGTIIANDGTFTYDGESSSLGGIGVIIGGAVNSFSNAGLIHGSDIGVAFAPYRDGVAQWDGPSSRVGSFINTATGTIEGNGLGGVLISAGVDSFVNNGQITARNTSFGDGVVISGGVTAFTNTGSISGYGTGVQINGAFHTFNNSGTITGTTGFGVYAYDGESAVAFGSFTNSGTINGLNTGVGLYNTRNLIDIFNSGTIQATTLFGNSTGLVFNGGTLVNSGTIKGGVGVTVNTDAGDASITNSGTIIGTNGAGIWFTGVADPTVYNSGLISGSNGIAVDFGNTVGNNLILQTGGKFIGQVKYGPGPNSFDFSGYRGNMLFGYSGTAPTLASGDKLFVNDHAGHIAIVDDTSIREAAQPVEDLVGAIHDSLHDALSGGANSASGQSFVANYLPNRTTPAAAAAMGVGAAAAPAGTTLWGDIFGGGNSNSNGAGTNTQFGGLVVGAHTEFSPGLTLGLLGSYGHTNFNITNGPQTISANVGTVGVYGRTSLDTVTLDFSVLGGFGSNDSSRDISTPGGMQTATASFSSWFLAPELGASIPVLHFNADGQMNVAGRVGYIGGSFDGYTETGSGANATVGAETIGVFTASAEINGSQKLASTGAGDVTLTGKLGVFTQNAANGAIVPVSVLGLNTAGAVGNGASGTGVYAGFGIETAMTAGLSIGANVTGSVRSDGNYGGLGRLRISGSY